eukprot:CAMPEP_0180811434 /NCGR_PEP_ID=MMETSP1038_2-20121128/65427_1 /TAXON_ID=632150 /ORGANISM="Azadinium spinosum, Strain 3D9" /LENGTH=86 /DNA_ID=CAMNT_0022852813 /DNA_START=91 /DNA_END=349 /DNA_ORIENTATION=+
MAVPIAGCEDMPAAGCAAGELIGRLYAEVAELSWASSKVRQMLWSTVHMLWSKRCCMALSGSTSQGSTAHQMLCAPPHSSRSRASN